MKKKNTLVENPELINEMDKEPCTLYQKIQASKPTYSYNEEALAAFESQAKVFEVKYGRLFKDLCLESENFSFWSEDMDKINSLRRKIQMINYLINKKANQVSK